jgi:hypothetical protein
MSLYEVIVKMEKLRTACTKTTNRSLKKKTNQCQRPKQGAHHLSSLCEVQRGHMSPFRWAKMTHAGGI